MQQEASRDHAEEGTVLTEALDRRAADRAWKKRRRLLALGIVPLALLLVANLALAVSLSRVRADLEEVRGLAGLEDGAPEEPGAAGTSAAAEDVEDLKASVLELQQTLREQREDSVSSTGGSAVTAGTEVKRLRREVRRTRAEVRCTDRALRRLDTSLRRLLTRNLDPQVYVDGLPLPDC